MISSLRNLPAYVVSLIVHVLVVLALLFVPYAIDKAAPELALETIFDEERDAVEYDQELDPEMEVSESLSFVSGGTVSTSMGANSQPVAAQVRVTESTALREPDLNPSLNDIAIPTESTIMQELGEGEITGETGAVVDGYGAAMHRLTAEILRMMRERRTVVIWLFDESGSMRDDQQEIKNNFKKVYAELGIAQQQQEARGRRRKTPDILQTVIASYGATVTDRTNPANPAQSRPTSNLEQIFAAIDSIPVDETGAENMCSAIVQVCNKYGSLARNRKLAIVIVSDESGDDGVQIDTAIQACRRIKAPVYVLGREAVFGYPYTRQDWVHKETGLVFHLRIRRGPETAYPECLQWDGIHNRWDAYGSGFGPYEQVRLARDTGGIFFQLPGEEEDITRTGANERRQFDALAMKIYQPLLLPRRVYKAERDSRPFRNALFQVISRLNPTENKLLFDTYDPELNMRRLHFSVVPARFAEEAAVQVRRAAKAMVLVDQGLAMLEAVEKDRALEESQRWRAGFDLAYAQLVTFRLRLYQYLLVIDEQVNGGRTPKRKESNVWNMRPRRKGIVPNQAQFSRLQTTFGIRQTRDEYISMVRQEERRATDLLKRVMDLHPGTPWARRARYEMNQGFGHEFVEAFYDPRYTTLGPQIKKPNL